MATTAAPCIHHWLVETPAGPRVAARCRRCGASRSFATAGIELAPDDVRRPRSERAREDNRGRDLGAFDHEPPLDTGIASR